MKVCAEPGCPELSTSTRCTKHTRAKDRARGTRQQRGYDAAHVRLRAQWQRRMDAGEVVYCWRCKVTRIDPRNWDLGHHDDRSGYAGPECKSCNRATASRR